VSGITLHAGKYEATFLPDAAMLCASLRFGGDEYVAWPRTIEEFRAGRATAIPLVHPWANRLAGDSYHAAGVDVSLAGLTLPHDPNGLLIHGNLFAVPFELQQANDTRIVARLDYGAHPEKLRAFPFPHIVTVDARLHPTRGLNVVTQVEPTSDRAVPISFGWHPFLQLPNAPRAEWELRWPACEHLDVDDHLIPTGTRTPQPAQREPIAARTFDDHYALGPDRTFAISGGSGRDRRTLTLQFDPAYPFAQLFVPPESELVAIEPMTAGIDALGRGTTPFVGAGGRFLAAFNLAVTTS
jgi:galactose mutarotase-like enzyme